MPITGYNFTVHDGDWSRLRQVLQQIGSLLYAANSEPTFAGLTLTKNLKLAGSFTLSGGSYQHVGVILSNTKGLLSSLASTTSGNKYLQSDSSGVINWETINYADISGAPSLGSYITLTSLSSTATGLTYTNTTGVFSLTSGYVIPTTTEESNWNTAYGWGNPSGVYLPIAGTAANSSELGGQLPAYYATASSLSGYQPLATPLTGLSSLASSTGFLKQTPAGTFGNDAFGTSTYIPVSNGSGFTYYSGLIGNSYGIGIGNDSPVPSDTIGWLYINNITATRGITGINLTGYTTANGVTGGGTNYGLKFSIAWFPSLMSANRSAASITGCYGGASIWTTTNETHNATVTSGYGFYSSGSTSDGSGATGHPIFTNYYGFCSAAASLSPLGQITNCYAFYDSGQAVSGVANAWGFYGLTANNYLSGGLQVGGTAATGQTAGVVTAAYFQTSTAATTASTGVDTIFDRTAVGASNTGWIPVKLSTGATVYIPYWV